MDEEIWWYCEECDEWFPPDHSNICDNCGNQMVEMSMLE